MQRSFVLVANNQLDLPFISRVTGILSRYGKPAVLPEDELPGPLIPLALVVIDASDVRDAPALVKILRLANPRIPVVVFVMADDLDVARAVFKMGATDCLVKGLDEDTFRLRLKSIYLKPARKRLE